MFKSSLFQLDLKKNLFSFQTIQVLFHSAPRPSIQEQNNQIKIFNQNENVVELINVALMCQGGSMI